MRTSHKGFAEGLLFALNIFIVVLLWAGDSLVVPEWLQPVGRLHPLILHFPIVILLLAMVMEFFRFRPEFVNEKLYQRFTTYLLVLGALLSSMTVIMGLFLSRETGYEGGTLQWHKWFGVSVAFIGYGIYLWRDTSVYTPVIAKTGALVILFCLIVAGHFGADLTHGEDFILAPILRKDKPVVPVEQARIYQDVIAPIFETKCESCHNANKMKGGLMLSNAAALLKGGKTGKLFIPGQPGISLLLQRVHLPEEEKKHMPPIGKPQLTDQDKLLLYLWIKDKPDFKKKVIDLPATDSLRILASTRLKPTASADEVYDFPVADDQDIKKLNNNYRVIYALANASPALAVNIYNKSTYSVKVLEELDPIKKQIVRLDLNKMPVRDTDLKTIGRFENLRQLNLNFSDINGSGLKNLVSLKHLQTLSLAGTKLDPNTIRQIMAIKSLTELAIWDTGLKPGDIQQLQSAHKKIRLLSGYKDDGKPLKLTSPLLKNKSQIFQESFQLQLSNPIKGVDIRYTTDGSVPDSMRSASYRPGILFTQNTVLRARAFKPGWLGSDTVQFNFYKNTYTPDSIRFLAPADGKYNADGAKTLIDKELGGTNFGNMKWLGSQKEMAVLMFFKKNITLHVLSLNTMRNIASQIFLPAQVEVWGGRDEYHLRLLRTLKTVNPQRNDPFSVNTLECPLKIAEVLSCIKLVIKPLQKVPDWHPAKGKPAWIFTDELFLN